MIKLIVCDMDGTLIDRDEVLQDFLLDIASRLKQAGVLFTVATGRVEEMADTYVQRLGIDIPYIVSNGATIICRGEVLQRKQIPAAGLQELLTEADQMGMSIIYTKLGVESVIRATPWIINQRQTFNRYHLEQPIDDKAWSTLMIDKVTVMDDRRDGRIGRIEELCRQLPPDQYSFTRYTNKAVEIVEHSANKGAALHTVAQLLGIEMAHIMAIGDHQNDIEMLREAGIGVAVANSTTAAQEAADYICEASHAAGVLEAIERFCPQVLCQGET